MAHASRPTLQFRVDPPKKQRRLTVFFRLILIIPHAAIALMFYAVSVATAFGWVAALFIGRNPFQRFTVRLLVWLARVNGYMVFLTDRYPPLSLDDEPDYPLGAMLESGRLGRWSVFFRLILASPVLVVNGVVGVGLEILAVVAWFIVLVIGRLPAPLHQAFSVAVRFSLRVNAYVLLVQNRYPRGLFGDPAVATATQQDLSMLEVPSLRNVVAGGDAPTAESETPLTERVVGSDAPAPAPERADAVAWVEGDDVVTRAAPTAPEVGETTTTAPDPTVVAGRADWTLRTSRGAKRVVVMMMVLGVVGFGLYFWGLASLPKGQSADQVWADNYASDISTLRNAVFNAEPTFEAASVNWSAVADDCSAIADAYVPLDNVPFYPSPGPDRTLVNGVALIAQAVRSCNGSIVIKSDAAALPAMTTTFQRGERDLTVFLTEIPGQSV